MQDGKLGVAMMGPGRIVHRVMQDFHNAENCALSGMASRSPERAKAAQAEYHAKYAMSYEEMVACPEVDLVMSQHRITSIWRTQSFAWNTETRQEQGGDEKK